MTLLVHVRSAGGRSISVGSAKENVCRHLRTLVLYVKRNLDEGEGLEILTQHYTDTQIHITPCGEWKMENSWIGFKLNYRDIGYISLLWM